MKKEDDIMAEYLLKGGKMLAQTCPDCGCPIFEYKGRTSCVVCAERATESAGEAGGIPAAEIPAAPLQAAGPSSSLREALERALVTIADRATREPEPERCRTLMEAVREGAEALALVSRR